MDENISTSQANRIKRKSTWFRGTTHSPKDIENIKKNIKEFAFFAYIMHDMDKDSSLHIHFVGQVAGSRTIKSICEMLECDYQDVQDTKTPKHDIRYLIHADDKNKYQYDFHDIKTSNPDRLQYFFQSFTYSINDLYEDFYSVKTGSITRKAFLEKYASEFSNLPFYQKIKTLEVLDKMSFR